MEVVVFVSGWGEGVINRVINRINLSLCGGGCWFLSLFPLSFLSLILVFISVFVIKGIKLPSTNALRQATSKETAGF